MQTYTQRTKKHFKLPGKLVLVLAVALCLFLTAITPGNYQGDDPPVTSTEPVTTEEQGTEEPARTQDPGVEPEATQPPLEAFVQSDEGEYEEEETVELLIGLSRGKSPNNLVPEMAQGRGKAWEFSENYELEQLRIFILNVPASKAQEEMVRLRSLPGVRYVEQNGWVEATDITPNDPYFPRQYALKAIRAPQGWDVTTGSTMVTIAIVDSGVDYGHAELSGKLVPGHDFVYNDDIANDESGHGSHVAGIAAASSNNGLGIAGVSWGARIMPVKVLNANNRGSISNAAAGILWAANHGAQIINLSLGVDTSYATLENAVYEAAAKGVLVIASAGNLSGACDGTKVLYPAAYPVVMAVAATDANNQRASYSSCGPEVDVAAPGDWIESLDLVSRGGYATRSGTSMAAPHVAGLAAVLWGMPGNGSAASVRWSIESTADDRIGLPGWDPYSGAGLIQMDAALGAPPAPAPTSTSTATATLAPKPGPNLPAVENDSLPQPGPNWQPGNSLTWTPLPILGAALTSTPTSTATSTSMATQTPEEIPAKESEITAQAATQNNWWKRLDVFLSPFFCGGMSLILAGAGWVAAFKRRKPGRNGNVVL